MPKGNRLAERGKEGQPNIHGCFPVSFHSCFPSAPAGCISVVPPLLLLASLWGITVHRRYESWQHCGPLREKGPRVRKLGCSLLKDNFTVMEQFCIASQESCKLWWWVWVDIRRSCCHTVWWSLDLSYFFNYMKGFKKININGKMREMGTGTCATCSWSV